MTALPPEGNSAEPELEASRRALQAALGDGYALGRLVGEGGFARVFAARDLRLEREVAVKSVRPEMATSPELLVRFQREARALASLRHPNVMEIYSVGDGEGTAFFVMPLVDGESLAERLDREGALPVEECRRILVEAARGLEAAHRGGVIHRDVKPENLLLEGEERRVLVTDFGISRALSAGEASITRTGSYVGTPTYMSPEQASGDPADHRADLYALGVVAYEMLTGRPPFQGADGRKVLLQHLTDTPTPVRELRPDCPEALARVVERCLAKAPGERWGSARELAEAAASPMGEPTDARSDSEIDAGTDESGDRPPEVRRFLRAGAVGGVGSVGAGATEWALTGDLLYSLPLLAAGGVWALSSYARMWSAGWDLRDLVSGIGNGAREEGRSGSARDSLDDLAGSPWLDLVRECRGDRNQLFLALRRLPRSERERHPRIPDVADQLLARIIQGSRRLTALEQRMEAEGEDASDPGVPAEASGPPSGDPDPGAAYRQRVLAELQTAREEARSRTFAAVEALKALHLAAERLVESGRDADDDAREAVRRGWGVLRGTPAPPSP